MCFNILMTMLFVCSFSVLSPQKTYYRVGHRVWFKKGIQNWGPGRRDMGRGMRNFPTIPKTTVHPTLPIFLTFLLWTSLGI